MTQYTPPTTDALIALKDELELTGAQMADLAALGGSHQWRKYTGGAEPRPMGLHMLFFMAARLELSDAEFERVLDKMRAIGASVTQSPHNVNNG